MGTYGFIVAMSLVMHISFAHWNSGAFGEQIRQAAVDYKQLFNDDACRLFRRFLTQVAGDKNMCPGVDSEEAIFNAMCASWGFRRAGSKIGLARFYAVYTALHEFMSDWHLRLVCILYILLDLYMVQG